MEKKVIDCFPHKHLLIPLEKMGDAMGNFICYGCSKPVGDREMAYVCMEESCKDKSILHNKCAELPAQILHPKHPHHPIHLFDFHCEWGHFCDVCRRGLDNVIGYHCADCDFDIDIACKKVGIDALSEGERKQLQHPSHPAHPLTLMSKPATLSYCDGCGEEDVDMVYICSTCDFWVHKSCALLPVTCQYQRHHHRLSLAYSIPMEHRRYIQKCEICDRLLDLTCWVYFCGDCRYFVHLKCVGSTKSHTSNLNEDRDDGSDVMVKFPLHAHELSKELITRFVMKEKGLDCIPDAEDDHNDSPFLDYHEHPLSLVLEPSHQDKDDEGEDEGEDDLCQICEACVTPISSPPYYECVSCKYFIHFICYLLPKNIGSSSPHLQVYGDCQETPNKNHTFRLFSNSKSTHKDLMPYVCDLCWLHTTGMGYECGDCKKRIDLKCASLPTTITHAFHSHKSLILTKIPPHQDRSEECRACLNIIHDGQFAYCCSREDCDFKLHLTSAQQTMSVIKRELDKHPLLLTSDASLDHPSDFFCEFCEGEIHPKAWMHFCRQCDASYHLGCLVTASGVCKNIKLGVISRWIEFTLTLSDSIILLSRSGVIFVQLLCIPVLDSNACPAIMSCAMLVDFDNMA